MPNQTVTIPLADYERLLEAAEGDDMIVYCETCGAWLDRNNPDTATIEDFTGCWKAATSDSRYESTCKSYRATVRGPVPLKEKAHPVPVG